MNLPSAKTFAVCLAAAITPSGASAAGTSAVTLSPVCVTKAGAALFLAEQSDDCGGAKRRCRGVRWAWASLGKSWEFEALAEASDDEGASPEANLAATRQVFKGPSTQVCERYLRAPKLREPNLADSDSFFAYSIERGALTLHWSGQKVYVAGEVRLSRAAWCGRGCTGREGPKAEARPIESGFTLVDRRGGKEATAVVVPTVSFTVGADAILGFPEPSPTDGEAGFVVLQVPEARLRETQAKILHQDARKLLEKAGDLLSESRAAGLLDASLQLNGADAEARLDYARILARQGEAAATVRELEKIRSTKDLRSRLESDRAFVPVKGHDAYKKFLESLAR